MVKKKEENGNNKDHHPLFRQELTTGQKAADAIAKFGGSWTFIIIFFVFLVMWMIVNSIFLIKKPFDPFPYILLNLTLSTLAAIQAPVILMAQNRQAERDRVDAKYDYAINRKAERENQQLQRDLDKITQMLKEIKRKKT